MFIVAKHVYRLKDIITNVTDKYKTDISYTQAQCAKNQALNKIRDPLKDLFKLLPTYCYNLK